MHILPSLTKQAVLLLQITIVRVFIRDLHLHMYEADAVFLKES